MATSRRPTVLVAESDKAQRFQCRIRGYDTFGHYDVTQALALMSLLAEYKKLAAKYADYGEFLADVAADQECPIADDPEFAAELLQTAGEIVQDVTLSDSVFSFKFEVNEILTRPSMREVYREVEQGVSKVATGVFRLRKASGL